MKTAWYAVPFGVERIFGVLAEETDESDAIFAKHVFVFLYCRSFGATQSEESSSQDKRGQFFGGSGTGLFVLWKKAKPAIYDETETHRAGTAA